MRSLRRLCNSGSPSHPSLALALATAFGGSVVSGNAAAQETADQELTDAVTLESITVTARKLEEPVQQIPFGITVFDAGSIDRERIRDARSFGRSTPGFNFLDTGVRSGNLPSIRGVGSLLPTSSDDTSVPVFIDGVPVPVRAQDQEFFDVERIEVLRGPQNTVFGRNAQGGAINITTADPTFEPLFEIGGEIGTLGHRRVTGLASGPLSESVAGRVSGQFDTRDGDIDDVDGDDDIRAQDILNLNGKVLWIPSDDTDLTLGVRYGNYDEELGQGLLDDPDFPRQFADTTQNYDLETVGAGLTVTHDFGDAALTSVTGIQYYSVELQQDLTEGLVFGALTGLPPAFFDDPNADFRLQSEEDFQVSQEIRFDGELANGIRWLAGLSFFRADFNIDVNFRSTGEVFGDFSEEVVSTSYAVFGEATLPVTDRLRAIFGLRYTYEIRDFEGQFTDLSGTAPVSATSQTDDRSFNLVTGRAALSYDILPELTGFASVSRGAKAGGFQLLDFDVTRGFPTSEFEPAFTWAYEAGLRGTLWDGRLDISTSAFFNDTKDEHVQVFDVESLQFALENLDVQTYGLELESVARPAKGLSFSFGLGLLQTEITSSDDPTIAVGNEVPFAPSLTFNLAAQYEHPLDVLGRAGDLFGRVEYQSVGSRTVDAENTVDLDSFDLVNLRFGWDSESISVYGFVDNLFDETYAEAAFVFGLSPTGDPVAAGVPGLPRRAGVGVSVRF